MLFNKEKKNIESMKNFCYFFSETTELEDKIRYMSTSTVILMLVNSTTLYLTITFF